MTDIDARLDALEQRVATLAVANERLRTDNAALRARIAAHLDDDPAGTGRTSEADQVLGDARPVSRRGMIAAAAGAAGGLLLAHATPAAAANGDPVKLGQTNTATDTTVIQTSGLTTLRVQNQAPNGYAAYGWSVPASGNGIGVFGYSAGLAGSGVTGLAAAPSGFTYGVRGEALSPDGRGVHGRASSESGIAIGVEGESASTLGRGVRGWASAATGITTGVNGVSDSTSGIGVSGVASATTGTTFGVRASANSPSGVGMFATCPGTSGKLGGFAVLAAGRLKATGRTYLGTPNSAPNNADLENGSVSFFLDQTNNELRVRVKYSGGAIKNGAIPLS